MKSRKAFSLIELLVIVAVVVIIAAVTIPAYKKHSGKAKIEQIKSELGTQLDAWVEKNSFGDNKSDIHVGNLGNYLSSVTLNFAHAGTHPNQVVGTIAKSSTGTAADGVTLIFTPTISDNSTTWSCTYTGVKPGASEFIPHDFCTCKGSC